MNKSVRHQFRAYDTDVELCLVTDDEPLSAAIVKQIERAAVDFEKRFSRFDTASELSQINAGAGRRVAISPEMMEVLCLAREAFRISDGVFDPTIGAVLSESGYDNSFALLTGSRETPDTAAGGVRTDVESYSFHDVLIDEHNMTVEVPAGVSIDLGGIAKGFWVDQMKNLLDKYFENYWIGAGGDFFFRGLDEMGEPWQVTIQNPLMLGENILSLNVPADGCGVATSGITKRQGIHHGKKWNHLIDTRTNARVKNSVLAVTVLAGSTADADVLAKTVLILGVRRGLAFIRKIEKAECVIIDRNLKMHISAGIKKFL